MNVLRLWNCKLLSTATRSSTSKTRMALILCSAALTGTGCTPPVRGNSTPAHAQHAESGPLIEPTSISLSGAWKFQVDPSNEGEGKRWFRRGYDASSWHNVRVPHTWNVMEQFYEYIGEAWYRLDFIPGIDATGAQVYLRFEAVYYKADVWLNNEFLGTHEGGYTPFQFDVSGLLEPDSTNTIVVKVENDRLDHRIPDDHFDWWPYGGIVRDVSLEVSNQVFIERQVLVAVPNITAWDEADSADVHDSITLCNTSTQDFVGSVSALIHERQMEPSIAEIHPGEPLHIPAGERIQIDLEATILSPKLWHFDHPDLYVWETTLVDADGRIWHTQAEIFGIRSVELMDGQFLLNGEPVRLVGMTRHTDSPQYGLAEPRSVMTADFEDMKRLNSVLSRPVHYPQDETVYEYCDRNGILLVPEIPAWQIEEDHLANSETLETAKQQLREMILSAINHPSIWAWSVANEIDSDTAAGRRYVQELMQTAKQLDPTRPVGFASYRLAERQEQDATAFTDFVFMNEYAGSWHGKKSSLARSLERIHELWPQKVVIISEFGLEAGWTEDWWMGPSSQYETDEYYYIQPGTPPHSDAVYTQRRKVIQDQMDVFRQYPFVAGAIFWTYQDYRSDSGFKMGLLDENRNRTPIWQVIEKQYSPIQFVSVTPSDEAGRYSVVVQTRGPIAEDMPAYTLRSYTLTWKTVAHTEAPPTSEGKMLLPELAPSASWTGELNLAPPDDDFTIVLQITRPTGFPVWQQTFDSEGQPLQ